MLQIINDCGSSLKRAMRRLRGSRAKVPFPGATRADIRHILVCRPSHKLGDMLLITPLVSELAQLFPNSRIDIFAKGPAARAIFRNYPNITLLSLPRHPFRELFASLSLWFRLSARSRSYDLVVNAAPHSFAGRLATRLANGRHKYYGHPGIDGLHAGSRPVQGLRKYLGIGPGAVPLLDLRLSPAEINTGGTKLEQLLVNGNPTICLCTDATGEKWYTPFFWNMFYQALQKQCKGYNIVEILPLHGQSMLGFRAPVFYSMDIREIGSVMANTALCIGADSGLLQLASSAQIPVIGLFCASDPARKGPYGNGSLAIGTNTSGIEDCIAAVNSILVSHRIAGPRAINFGN